MLVDDDWLYGGTIENIEQTITGGRKGVMTAHGNILKLKRWMNWPTR